LAQVQLSACTQSVKNRPLRFTLAYSRLAFSIRLSLSTMRASLAAAVMLVTSTSLALGGRFESFEEEEALTRRQDCTGSQSAELASRFKKDDLCEEEPDGLKYVNPNSTKLVSLYLYPPKAAGRDAFNLCQGRVFDPAMCYRLWAQSEHYSVLLHRVDDIHEATSFVRRLPENVKIKHLVLAGHGTKQMLVWGSLADPDAYPTLRVDEEGTNFFLAAVYSALVPHSSTVFLDSCSNAGKVSGKNLLQYVAHRLAGVTVYGSSDCFTGNLVHVEDAKDFKVRIQKADQDLIVQANFGAPELRDWTYYQDETCAPVLEGPATSSQTLAECHARCEGSTGCRALAFEPAAGRCLLCGSRERVPREGLMLLMKP